MRPERRAKQGGGGCVPGRDRMGAARLFVASILLGLGGCSYGIIDPRGPIGRADQLIMRNALVIMLAIVVPTLMATVLFAWWFRASNTRARYRPGFAYSGRLELLIWSIPTLVTVFIAGLIWIGSHQLDPAEPIPSNARPLDIQVVSLDWKWLFIYPEQQVASVNQVVVPAGVPLRFAITSASVMNTFFVPQLGSMIYSMDGMVTQLNLLADDPGDYPGLSGMFSGDGFSDMRFVVHAVPAAAFESWVARTKSTGPALDRAGYAQLARESQNVAPYTYRTVDPDLFAAIATQKIPAQAGPSSGQGGVNVHPIPKA